MSSKVPKYPIFRPRVSHKSLLPRESPFMFFARGSKMRKSSVLCGLGFVISMAGPMEDGFRERSRGVVVVGLGLCWKECLGTIG
jgi:hypothetical protein